MNMFGLGILLNAKDQASASIYRVSNSLEELSKQLEKTGTASKQQMAVITESIKSATKELDLGVAFNSVGNTFIDMGKSMVSPLADLSKQVISTSSQFEQWRMTLKALYGDADVASQKLQWGMNLAAQTPFDVEDVTQALIGFKAVGAEADTQFANASGEMRSFLEYMGDLAALRPDVGLQGVLMGVRNLLGGDGGHSLRMRMDIDLENILGKDFGTTTEEIMQDLVTVSDKLANGLMTELEGTWSQMISNLEDQSTRFFLAIGDGGAFDSLKSALKTISDAIGEIDDDRMAKIGKNIADALNMIIKPIGFVVNVITQFAKAIITLIETSPLFSKLIVGFMGVVAVGTMFSGLLFVLNGGFHLLKGALALIPGLLGMLKTNLLIVGSTLVSFLPKILLWSTAMSVIKTAWTKDFGGIRTTLTNLMNNLYKAFSYSAEISRMGVDDMKKALADLDTTTFGGWLTYRLVQIRVLFMALVDAWNDNTLSDENFQKASELGLLPLIEKVLDAKARVESFVKGFVEGFTVIFETASKVVKAVTGFLEDLVQFFFPVEDGVNGVNDSVKNLDLDKWERFGEISSYVVTAIGGILLFAKIVGVIVKIGSALWTVGKTIWSVVTFVWKIIQGIGTFVSTIGGITLAILEFFGIIVSAPAWLVGAIVVALVAIVALVIKYWDEIVEWTKWLWGKICEYATMIGEWFSGIWDSICESAKVIWEKICEFVSNACSKLGEMWDSLCEVSKSIWKAIVDYVSEVWNNIVEFVSKAWDKIVEYSQPMINFFSGLGKIIMGVFEIAWSVIVGACKIAWNVIKLVVGLAWEGIKVIVKGAYDFIVYLWGGIKNFFSEVWNYVHQKIITPVWDFIVKAISNAYDKITKTWEGIKSFFKAVWEFVNNNIIVPIVNAIINTITNAYDKVVSTWDKIKNFFSEAWNFVYNSIIIPIWNFIVTTITNAYNNVINVWNMIKEFFQSVWDFVLNSIIIPIWEFIVNTITNAYNNITATWEVIKTFFSEVWDFVLNSIISPIWEGIKNLISNAYTNITNLWEGIKNFFKGIWDFVSSIVSGVWEGINSVVGGAYDYVCGIWNGLTGAFSTIWNEVKNGAIELFEWLAGKFEWVANIAGSISNAWQGIKDGASHGWESIKEGAKQMVGLNTGGYVKTEGVAMLHPNEVVVNDDLTQKLRSYLNENDRKDSQSTPSVINTINPNITVKVPDLNNVISLADYREKKQSTVEPMVSNVDYSKTLTSNYANDYSRSLVNNENVSNNTNDYSTTNNEDIKTVYNKISNVSNVSNINEGKTKSATATAEKVDNSVNISEGAIQITMTNGNEQEIDALVKKLFQKIQRENELRNTLRYKAN